MTETSILPISGDDVTSPPNDGQPADEGSAAGANRRKLLVVGGVAGVVVLAAAAFMLLHGGSPSSTAATAVVPHGTPKAVATANAQAGTSTKTTKLPRKSKVQAGRDPFGPLFTAPVTTGTAVGGTTTVVSPTPVPTTSAPAGGPTPTPTPTAPTAGPLGVPKYVQLLSTKGKHSATFRVGYAHHKFKQFDVQAPAAGSSTATVFATDFALIQVKPGGVATIQIGDDPPFDLSEGLPRQL
jgi:hypothetical protein